MNDGTVKYEITADSSGLQQAARRGEGSITSLGRAGQVASAGMVAALATATAAATGVGLALREAASMETTEAGIATLVKNAAVAKGIVGEIRKLAAETPMGVGELAGAARGLLGGGTAVKDLKAELLTLGDISAGAQTDLAGLVLVLNQVRGAGKLMGGDFLQLQQKGIGGLRQELARVKGIDVSELAKSIERGEVSAEDLMTAFRNLTSEGGLFFGAMETQSRTLEGKISTLGDAFKSLLLVPGNMLLEPAKEFVTTLTGGLERAARQGAVIGETLRLAAAESRLGEVVGVGVALGLKTAWLGLIEFVGSSGRAFRQAIEDEVAKAIAMGYNASVGKLTGVELPVDTGSFAEGLTRGLRSDLGELQKQWDEFTTAGRLSLEAGLKGTADAAAEAMTTAAGGLDTAAKKAGAAAGAVKAAGRGGLGGADTDGDGFTSKREKRVFDLAQERGQRHADAIKGYSRKRAGDVDFGGLDEFYALQMRERGMGYEGRRAFSAFGNKRTGAASAAQFGAVSGAFRDAAGDAGFAPRDRAFRALDRTREAAGAAAARTPGADATGTGVLREILIELRRIRTT